VKVAITVGLKSGCHLRLDVEARDRVFDPLGGSAVTAVAGGLQRASVPDEAVAVELANEAGYASWTLDSGFDAEGQRSPDVDTADRARVVALLAELAYHLRWRRLPLVIGQQTTFEDGAVVEWRRSTS